MHRVCGYKRNISIRSKLRSSSYTVTDPTNDMKCSKLFISLRSYRQASNSKETQKQKAAEAVHALNRSVSNISDAVSFYASRLLFRHAETKDSIYDSDTTIFYAGKLKERLKDRLNENC